MRVNRMAPPFFARSPADESKAFWRGLRIAFVARGGAYFDVVNGKRTTTATGSGWSGTATANGYAVRNVNNGFYADNHDRVIPTAPPLSVFSFLVRHDSSSAVQALFGSGQLGGGGWSLELNYTAGQIGLTRWTVADHPTTTLGAVPIGTASAIAMSYDASTARFMLNGKFENVSVGNTAGTIRAPRIGCAADGGGSAINLVQDTSIHLVYCWDRLLADHEMLRLWMDPWVPVRPSRGMYLGAGAGGGGGTGARSFAAMIG